MSRIARFAALLSVLLVIGVGRVAWSATGQPVILGVRNTEGTATIIDNPSRHNEALIVENHSDENAMSIVHTGGQTGGGGLDIYINTDGGALGTQNPNLSGSARHRAPHLDGAL